MPVNLNQKQVHGTSQHRGMLKIQIKLEIRFNNAEIRLKKPCITLIYQNRHMSILARHYSNRNTHVPQAFLLLILGGLTK